MKNKLIKLFEENGIYGIDNLDEDLGLDSLQFISLIISIEDYFEIEINSEELLIEKLKTFNDFFAMLNNYDIENKKLDVKN